jgi:gentisate 1,2-dioxygenase
MIEAELAKLYQEMDSLHLRPLWKERESVMPSTPRPKMVPWLWKWAQLHEMARRAGSLVPVDRGGDRRVIALSNPGLGAVPYATPTLWVALQWLNGREVAPAHRHSAQAVRFMLEGHGAYSTVQGDKIYLERGDFAINPPWYWHNHGSEADGPAVWMDGLDVPLDNYLGASFFETHSKDEQDVTAIIDGSGMKYGVGQLRPAWEAPCAEYSPISTYKWQLTERALNNLAQVASSPFDDVALEYTNPHTGRPVMDTMTAWIQMLRPAVHTQAHRQINTAVYHVFEGRGATVIDGVRFDWEQGDMFAVPSWAYHEHLNASSSDRAILFSLQDTPVLKALGKYREEAYTQHEGHQPVKATFDVERAAVSS